MHVIKGMGSSANSAFTAVTTTDVSCVLAVDIIRWMFYPAYTRTGNEGGRWFRCCIECVTEWTDEIFTTETNAVLAHFPTACTAMVCAIHSQAKMNGQAYELTEGIKNETIAREVIRRLLLCSSTEPSVLNGTFLTDSVSASTVGVRLMYNVTTSVVHDRNFIILNMDVKQPHAPSSVISTGVQTTPEKTADAVYDEIYPDDSVSVANIRRPNSTIADAYASRNEVTFSDLVMMQNEIELSDRGGIYGQEPRRVVAKAAYRPSYKTYYD